MIFQNSIKYKPNISLYILPTSEYQHKELIKIVRKNSIKLVSESSRHKTPKENVDNLSKLLENIFISSTAKFIDNKDHKSMSIFYKLRNLYNKIIKLSFKNQLLQIINDYPFINRQYTRFNKYDESLINLLLQVNFNRRLHNYKTEINSLLTISDKLSWPPSLVLIRLNNEMNANIINSIKPMIKRKYLKHYELVFNNIHFLNDCYKNLLNSSKIFDIVINRKFMDEYYQHFETINALEQISKAMNISISHFIKDFIIAIGHETLKELTY